MSDAEVGLVEVSGRIAAFETITRWDTGVPTRVAIVRLKPEFQKAADNAIDAVAIPVEDLKRKPWVGFWETWSWNKEGPPKEVLRENRMRGMTATGLMLKNPKGRLNSMHYNMGDNLHMELTLAPGRMAFHERQDKVPGAPKMIYMAVDKWTLSYY